MYRIHQFCRACNYAKPIGPPGIKAAPKGERLEPVFSLGIQPLANDFCRAGDERAGYAPLEVLLCPRCHLAQLSVVVRPDILYSRYLYVTSPSQTMLAHFAALWKDISAGRTIKSVLEIGSNDGTLLAWLQKECGVEKVQGVDPAENLADEARRHGVPTMAALFPQDVRSTFLMRQQPPDLIIARHVLCHVDDWQDFFAGIEVLCGPETVVCIETPWVHDMLVANSFDQIYHEHLSYLSIRSIEAVLRPTNLMLRRVIHYPIHGGAVLLVIGRKDQALPLDDSVDHFRAQEPQGADAWRRSWVGFSERAKKLQGMLVKEVAALRGAGEIVAALGASAKSTVWVNACGFIRKGIAFIADSTPGKWETTSPGTDIPIVDEGAILREMPDHLLLFCWNFAVEAIQKNQLYLAKGGHIIIPVPSIQVVSAVNGLDHGPQPTPAL